MSYTPESQLLEEPLRKAADALQNLGHPIRERLDNPSEWNAEHLTELEQLLLDITAMEIRLKRLSHEVR